MKESPPPHQGSDEDDVYLTGDLSCGVGKTSV